MRDSKDQSVRETAEIRQCVSEAAEIVSEEAEIKGSVSEAAEIRQSMRDSKDQTV